jgi:hypothetical protein
MGFSNNETHYTKGSGTKPSEFTLKYQNHSGNPMGATYDHWVSGIRDPRTNIATYPKEFNLEYHSSNHTGTLLYVVTRPDANNFEGKNIEFASLWTHVQPKRINMEQYNFEQGSHDMSDADQPFAGVMNFGPKVVDFAQGYVSGDNKYQFLTEADFNIEQYIA